MARQTNSFKPDWIPTLPGEHIWELMFTKKINTEYFCSIMNISLDDFWDLMHGRKKIDKEIANDLVKFIFKNTTAHFWLTLQKNYSEYFEKESAKWKAFREKEALQTNPYLRDIPEAYIKDAE